MIGITNFVRSYVFLLDHMIGDRSYQGLMTLVTCANFAFLAEKYRLMQIYIILRNVVFRDPPIRVTKR